LRISLRTSLRNSISSRGRDFNRLHRGVWLVCHYNRLRHAVASNLHGIKLRCVADCPAPPEWVEGRKNWRGSRIRTRRSVFGDRQFRPLSLLPRLAGRGMNAGVLCLLFPVPCLLTSSLCGPCACGRSAELGELKAPVVRLLFFVLSSSCSCTSDTARYNFAHYVCSPNVARPPRLASTWGWHPATQAWWPLLPILNCLRKAVRSGHAQPSTINHKKPV